MRRRASPLHALLVPAPPPIGYQRNYRAAIDMRPRGPHPGAYRASRRDGAVTHAPGRRAGSGLPRSVARPAQIPETWTVPRPGNSLAGSSIFSYVRVSGFAGTPDQTVPPGRTGTRQRADVRRPAARGGRARLRYRPAWSLIAGPAVTLAM